ncbi:MAG: GatB/YqeY domain-containing protein, partial [Xanthobacteraceae bacterium]
MLRDEINTALKGAMKARDERRVSTLRLVNAALKNADLEAQGQGKPALGEDEVLGLLQKLIKQRQESVEIYDRAGRKELADQERGEIDII